GVAARSSGATGSGGRRGHVRLAGGWCLRPRRRSGARLSRLATHERQGRTRVVRAAPRVALRPSGAGRRRVRAGCVARRPGVAGEDGQNGHRGARADRGGPVRRSDPDRRCERVVGAGPCRRHRARSGGGAHLGSGGRYRDGGPGRAWRPMKTEVRPRHEAPRGPTGARAALAAYYHLTKPRIVLLLLITTVPSMVLADRGLPSLWLIAATLVGGTLSAGGANAINQFLDRDIDEI